MPFINIPVEIALQLKKDPELLQELLKKGIINVKEARLLEVALNASQNDPHAQKELEDLCQKYFNNEAETTKNRLTKFFTRDSQVSWVLFTRTAQAIPYDESNPLEDYVPQGEVEVLVIHYEHLIDKR